MIQQSLFDLSSELSQSTGAQSTKSNAGIVDEDVKTSIGKAREKVQEVIGKLEKGKSIHYATCGEWSMHDLLFHILEQTGPAEVWLTTWSGSENAFRQIIEKIKDKTITKLSCLFDWRLKVRRPEVFELAKFNISDIKMSSCHAKVTVIQNQDWHIAVITSANYTNNPRIEAGVISCDKSAAEFHKSWIEQEIQNADPFWVKKKK